MIIFFKIFAIYIWMSLTVTHLLYANTQEATDSSHFSDYEIRVIRPKYFWKKNTFELGLQTISISNESFSYTHLISPYFVYHILDYIALETAFGAGASVDKADKVELEKTFNIKTEVLHTDYIGFLSLLWTPMYGKYQWPSARMIYFDSYLSSGFGMNGIKYHYDHCPMSLDTKGNLVATSRPDETVFYPSLSLGAGQRIFINPSESLKWDVRLYTFNINSSDGACFDDQTNEVIAHDNIVFQFGYSYYL
jgi:outer membrane beta-barrel protein